MEMINGPKARPSWPPDLKYPNLVPFSVWAASLEVIEFKDETTTAEENENNLEYCCE